MNDGTSLPPPTSKSPAAPRVLPRLSSCWRDTQGAQRPYKLEASPSHRLHPCLGYLGHLSLFFTLLRTTTDSFSGQADHTVFMVRTDVFCLLLSGGKWTQSKKKMRFHVLLLFPPWLFFSNTNNISGSYFTSPPSHHPTHLSSVPGHVISTPSPFFLDCLLWTGFYLQDQVSRSQGHSFKHGSC